MEIRVELGSETEQSGEADFDVKQIGKPLEPSGC
jgi:hypothetical protein